MKILSHEDGTLVDRAGEPFVADEGMHLVAVTDEELRLARAGLTQFAGELVGISHFKLNHADGSVGIEGDAQELATQVGAMTAEIDQVITVQA